MSSGASSEAIESMRVLAVTVGTLSALGGCIILLTLFCFPTMMWKEKRIRNRNPESRDSMSVSSRISHNITDTAGVRSGKETNTYMHMVCMLAVSEVLGASAYAIGYPSSRSVCIAQGILVLFFQRAKWIWNAFIGYQLYRFMVHDMRGLSLLQMHAVCWSVCLLFEVLPLLGGVGYGANSSDRGIQSCWYSQSESAEVQRAVVNWFIVMYFVPLVSCILIMSYSAYHLWMRFQYLDSLNRQDDASMQIRKLCKTMVLYPVAMLITTLPNMVCFFLSALEVDWATPEHQYNVFSVALTWSFSFGLWLCVIFFYNSQEAKRRWRSLVLGVKYEDDGNKLIRRDDKKKQVTLTNFEKSINVALNNTAGKPVGPNKTLFEKSEVGINTTKGAKSQISQIEPPTDNPMFQSPKSSFDAKNMDDVV